MARRGIGVLAMTAAKDQNKTPASGAGRDATDYPEVHPGRHHDGASTPVVDRHRDTAVQHTCVNNRAEERRQIKFLFLRC